VEAQNPIDYTGDGEPVSNHDELMANFFAQPDALAFGKTKDQLVQEGTPKPLLPHKEFDGNRPSIQLLFPRFDAKTIGQLLSLFEHNVATRGFIWGNNSFDQFGVELGKVLGVNARKQLNAARTEDAKVEGFNPSTTYLMTKFLAK